jgi:uncharacterized protein YkwD
MKKIRFFLYILALSFFRITSSNAEEYQLIDPIQTSSALIQSQIETEVFNLINQSRLASFLPPLILSTVITTQARNHSLNMANKIVPFGHQGADIRFANLKNLIYKVTRFGENVAYNRGFTSPAEIAVSSWLRSPGHYANIMGDFNLTGVGVAKNLQGEYYFTQIFVKASVVNQNFQSQEIENIDEIFFLSPLESVSELPYLIELESISTKERL